MPADDLETPAERRLSRLAEDVRRLTETVERQALEIAALKRRCGLAPAPLTFLRPVSE